jgi:hypothetical protein
MGDRIVWNARTGCEYEGKPGIAEDILESTQKRQEYIIKKEHMTSVFFAFFHEAFKHFSKLDQEKVTVRDIFDFIECWLEQNSRLDRHPSD